MKFISILLGAVVMERMKGKVVERRRVREVKESPRERRGGERLVGVMVMAVGVMVMAVEVKRK